MSPASDRHEMSAPVRTVAADSTNNLSRADWPTGLLPAVAEQWGQQAPWRPQPTRIGAQASNDRHGLTASFDAQGLRLSSAAGEIHLSLAGFGRDGELQAPGAAEAELDGARVVYRHDANLTQWFINSPLGLEQGFTLERRPKGHGELRFALALGGDLAARLDQNELVFVDEAGAAQLRYGALVAYDARGQALPARMHLAGERLVLAVDDAGAAYPVVVDPLFAQLHKLTADDGGANGDDFGHSIALSGDTVLIGAPYVRLNGTHGVGAAYIFTRNGATWAQQAKLAIDDGAYLDNFGRSVALSGDTALVGAIRVDVDGISDAGAVYVFVRNGATWVQHAKLTADDGVSQDFFGSSVALHGDTALVGATHVHVGGISDAGAAYVFTLDGATATWSQQARLTADDAWYGNYFGASVALHGDTALIGAPHAGSDVAGAAYVFTRDDATWTQQATLAANDGARFDYLGASVTLSGDTAVVGAPGSMLSDPIVGAAYVFTRNDATWTQQAKLIANDGALSDQFGSSVALSSDTVLVGATHVSGEQGAAYIFTRNGATWTQQAKLIANEGAPGDRFGFSAALSSDTALVGTYRVDAAYLFGPAVDLQLVKRATLGAAPQGGLFGYSLYVTNRDPDVDATGVTVTDPLPPGVSYVADDGGCTTSGAIVTCALGPLAKGGGMAGVHMTVRANAAPGALITNTASASAEQPDAGPADNTDSVTTTISNTAPVASDSVLLAHEGAAVAAMLSAADAGGDALTFSIVSAAAKGAVVMTDAAAGAYTYTAAAGRSGVDAFTFKANDGIDDSNIATVSVIIQPANRVPAASSFAITTYEGTAVNGLLPAVDPDGDVLTFSIVANSVKGAAVITDVATGAFTYTPSTDQTGSDSFTFRATDNHGAVSNTATVTVTINALPAPGNAAPVTNDLTLVVFEGGETSGALSAADANGDALTFSIVANGAKGAAVITNAATGAFTYTPNPGETGTDTFTFKANDRAVDSNIATVTVTLQPANRVQVTGSRGGGGSFDLALLLLGATLVVMRRRRGM